MQGSVCVLVSMTTHSTTAHCKNQSVLFGSCLLPKNVFMTSLVTGLRRKTTLKFNLFICANSPQLCLQVAQGRMKANGVKTTPHPLSNTQS